MRANHFSRFKHLFIFFLLPFYLLAFDYNNLVFDQISLKDGLSQNTVYTICQDSLGFLWFGTQDGLNRFEGQKFRTFKNVSDDPSTLTNDEINSIIVNKDGNIWVGANCKELALFDYKSDSFIKFPLIDLKGDLGYINSMILDENENLWVSTSGHGVINFDTHSKTYQQFVYNKANPDSTLLSNYVTKIYQDHEGTIWACTAYGLNKYNAQDNFFETFFSNDSLNNPLTDLNLTTIIETPFLNKSYLWVGSDLGGLFRIDMSTNTVESFGYKSGKIKDFPEVTTQAFYLDDHDALWIGTMGAGIFILDREANLIKHLVNDPLNSQSLGENGIYSFFETTEALWIGTSGSGVSKLPFKRKAFYTKKTTEKNNLGIIDNQFFKIIEDNNLIVWFASWLNGIVRFDTQLDQFETLNQFMRSNDNLSNNAISDMVLDSKNNLWVLSAMTYLDKYAIPSNKITQIAPNQESKNNPLTEYPQCLQIIDDSLLYIGTWAEGLVKYNRNQNTFTNLISIANNDSFLFKLDVTQMYKGYQNSLWLVTTNKGIVHFDPAKETIIDRIQPDSTLKLVFNDIQCLFEDANKHLWIGSYSDGLIHYDINTKTYEVFTEKEGLPNNAVYQILEDNDNNLWISTNHGLSKFNKTFKTFRNYDVFDGIQSNEFNPAALKASDGRMYFAGIGGITYFYPNEIRDNTTKSNTYITEISINKPLNEDTRLDTAAIFLKELHLYPDDYMVIIQLASTEYTEPSKNQFAYYLEGFDLSWQYLKNKSQATFTSLPQGRYKLHIKSSNNDGYWGQEAQALEIIIHPPFWKTNWFIGFVIIAIACGLFIIYELRVNAIINREKELEKLNLQLQLEIKSRIEAHHKASERAKNFQSLVSQSPFPIAIINLDGSLSQSNDLWDQLYSGSKAEKNFNILKNKIANSLGIPPGFHTAKSGENFRILKAEHDNKFYNIRIYPLETREKRIWKIAIAFEDITEEVIQADLISKSLKQKEILLQEIHHRVKNNLQVITSLLGLQKLISTEPKTINIIGDFQNRIRAMALVHEELYRSEDFVDINLLTYLKKMIDNLHNTIGNIRVIPELISDQSEIRFSLDKAIPIGLIINELLSNSLIHAFPIDFKKKPKLIVELKKLNPKTVEVNVIDNGIGIPLDFEIENSKTMGLNLIYMLGEDQLGGSVSHMRDKGTIFKIKIPI